MLFLRLFGKLLLFAAFLALSYDGARVLATPSDGLVLTSISTHLRTHFPQARGNLEEFLLGHAPAYLWNGIVEPMLVVPVSILFAALGALIFMAGYRRPPPEIVSDQEPRAGHERGWVPSRSAFLTAGKILSDRISGVSGPGKR